MRRSTRGWGPRSRARLLLRGYALLVVGAGLGLAAYPVGRIELLYLGSLLVALPLFALVFVRFRRLRMGVARRFSPPLATAGEPVLARIEVRNLAGSRTPESTWYDVLPWRPFGTRTGRLRALSAHRSAASRGTATIVEYTFTPPRRGIVELGPFVLDFADPFALASGEAVVGEPQKLVVTPELIVLPDTGASIHADEGSARALQRRASGGDDELMTREYRSGDPLRRVHWRASAHHGELMVRQEEQRSHAQARILLDTRKNGYRDTTRATPERPESEAFEWAVRFTGSLALRLQRSGFTVRIVETAARQLASPEQLEEFLESLAAVNLVDEPRRDGAFSLLPDPGRSLGSVFAVLSNAEPHLVDRLAAQRHQFEMAIAFVVDSRVDTVERPLREAGWACVPVTADDDPFDAWVAAALAREAQLARA